MTSPLFDWDKIEQEASRVLAARKEEKDAKEKAEDDIRRAAAKFGEPFENFLTQLSRVTSSKMIKLEYCRHDAKGGYEMIVGIGHEVYVCDAVNNNKFDRDTLFGVRVHCTPRALWVNAIDNEADIPRQMSHGDIDSAKQAIVDWIMEVRPGLLSEIAARAKANELRL